jgi:hypothetical protein
MEFGGFTGCRPVRGMRFAKYSRSAVIRATTACGWRGVEVEMDPSRTLFVDLKDESRRLKPSYFFMMRCLLYSRLETGVSSSQEYMDEDVNVYLAHLLNSFSDPDYVENSKQYLHRYDHEVFKRLHRSTDARLKYVIYKTNADFLLLSIGVFDTPNQWLAAQVSDSRTSRRVYEPTEEASIGRGKTYYHFAYSYSQQVNRRHPAVTDVLEKLSVGFDRYLKVLSHMRGEYLDLVKELSKGEIYHLERTINKEKEREVLKSKQDLFLDQFLSWKQTGSADALDEMRRLAAEIQVMDPEFKFADTNLRRDAGPAERKEEKVS